MTAVDEATRPDTDLFERPSRPWIRPAEVVRDFGLKYASNGSSG